VPLNNFVHLSGNLADDPYFEMISGDTGKMPYIRFDLVVERDSEQGGPGPFDPAGNPEGFAGWPTGAGRKAERRADLIRVTEYGVRARLDFFYLKKGAQVTISGWLLSRRYLDRGTKRMRRVTEVNAQKISCGPGCDFVRGERQRLGILEQLEADRAAVPPDLVSGPIILGPEDAILDPM